MRCFLPILLVLCSAGHALEPLAGIPSRSRQLVLVVSKTWAASRGELRRYERAAQGPWRPVGAPVTVLLGERGMAWGLGLHSAPATRGVPTKREGDRRSPAGVFLLPSAFGFAENELRIPYRRVTADLEAVDDPASRFYNQIVQRADVAQVDWQSSEKMAAIPDYELGIVVAHNPRNLPGAGSCIFIHRWRGERQGTAGCTALHADDLEALAAWLNATLHPVLVQLPRSEVPARFP